jgi:hypothetical protein
MASGINFGLVETDEEVEAWCDGMEIIRRHSEVKMGASVSAYVAGPMRGIKDWNFPAFHEAAATLRAYGWTVFSPAERDEAMQWDTEYPNARPLWEYMIDDLPAVAKSSAVFFLPGWRNSEGARLEYTVARRLSIPCYDYEAATLISADWQDFENAASRESERLARHPNSARFHEILEGLGALHDQKQADYGRGDDPFANVRGSQEWGVDPWVGAMVRANDKIRRLQSFIANGNLKNESVDDSLRDLAVYAIIALVLFEQQAEGGTW